jgi:hypothetical protein
MRRLTFDELLKSTATNRLRLAYMGLSYFARRYGYRPALVLCARSDQRSGSPALEST